ncbi:hypothetical protein [Lentzea sp. NEAU-D7]|uniref:hypothetical protein n=1 Tax=Lentzea sp. NEAU-D7 TaxID=2994667 RepID=UPI003A4C6B89
MPTDVGSVEIEVQRDLDISFEPRIVAKHQRHLGGGGGGGGGRGGGPPPPPPKV